VVVVGAAGPAGQRDLLIARMTLELKPDRSFGAVGDPPAAPAAPTPAASDF
jgi:hypothetical protein